MLGEVRQVRRIGDGQQGGKGGMVDKVVAEAGYGKRTGNGKIRIEKYLQKLGGAQQWKHVKQVGHY